MGTMTKWPVQKHTEHHKHGVYKDATNDRIKTLRLRERKPCGRRPPARPHARPPAVGVPLIRPVFQT